MRRTGNLQFGFPRFHGALRYIVVVSAGIYIAIVLLSAFTRQAGDQILALGGLFPPAVGHGWIWQLVSYGFVDRDPWHFLMTMLAVYFLGSAVQERIGSRALLELYLSSLVGAGILGSVFTLTGAIRPDIVFGAGAAANAILMVFYLLFREAPIMLFPIPIPIPVKYIVIFTAAVEGAYFLLSRFALYYLVLLLGLVTISVVPVPMATRQPVCRGARPGLRDEELLSSLEAPPRCPQISSLHAQAPARSQAIL